MNDLSAVVQNLPRIRHPMLRQHQSADGSEGVRWCAIQVLSLCPPVTRLTFSNT
ncbi:MAG: hypothetical protein MZV64_35440 [Ignavibacteriales bacterium]|nr:hypothetical protein [Ignavibacteriales bacterium]